MVGHHDGHHFVLQLNDDEAEVLAAKLTALVERRRKMIAKEPSMRFWSDTAHAQPAVFNHKHLTVSITIADPQV